VALAVFLLQKKLVYPVSERALVPRMDGGELLEISGPGGRTVYALYVPAPAGQPTVVHFHGNAQELADLVPLAWKFHRNRLGFCAVEYPGYGLARQWDPSESQIYADAEAALWHLHNGRKIQPDDIVLQGQSLGSAVAAEMAERGHGSRLVLISPFTSIVDMAQRTLPILPMRLIVTERFDTASKAEALTLPVFIVHGGADTLVPVAMGERLAELFPNATLRVVRDAGHDNLFVRDGDAIVDAIARFARGELITR
jgi:uncharacterized protein